MTVGKSLTVLWNVEAGDPNIVVQGSQAVESDTAKSGSVHVVGEGIVSASGINSSEAEVLSELPYTITGRYEVNIAVDESKLAVEVLHEGRCIGLGYGDDIVEALLSLIPYMLPTDHPEYQSYLVANTRALGEDCLHEAKELRRRPGLGGGVKFASTRYPRTKRALRD